MSDHGEDANWVERALGFVAEFQGDDRCALNCRHAEALAGEVLRLRAALARRSPPPPEQACGTCRHWMSGATRAITPHRVGICQRGVSMGTNRGIVATFCCNLYESAEVESLPLAGAQEPRDCGCRCSDAWRCARDQQRTDRIACGCPCHRARSKMGISQTQETIADLAATHDDQSEAPAGAQDPQVRFVLNRDGHACYDVLVLLFEEAAGAGSADAAGMVKDFDALRKRCLAKALTALHAQPEAPAGAAGLQPPNEVMLQTLKAIWLLLGSIDDANIEQLLRQLVEDAIAVATVSPSSEGLREMEHCGFSTGIGGEITAGRGRLDDHGYWERPCQECVQRAEYRFEQQRTLEASCETLRQERDLQKVAHLHWQAEAHEGESRLAQAEAQITGLRKALEQIRDEMSERMQGDDIYGGDYVQMGRWRDTLAALATPEATCESFNGATPTRKALCYALDIIREMKCQPPVGMLEHLSELLAKVKVATPEAAPTEAK